MAALGEKIALVVGVGGLGGPAALALAAGGVGDLAAQPLLAAGDLGRPRADAAAGRLARLSPAA